jgi:hypothetical protein
MSMRILEALGGIQKDITGLNTRIESIQTAIVSIQRV